MEDPARNPYAAGSGRAGNSPAGPADGSSDFAPFVRTGKLITLGLAMGLVTTTGILLTLWLTTGPVDQPLFRFGGDATFFLAIGFGKLLICLIGWVVIRVVFNRKIAQIVKSSNEPIPVPIRDDTPLPRQAKPALQAVMASNLIGQALLEGPAMSNAVLMYIERNALFAIPIVIGLVGVLIQMPTVGKFRSRLENAAL